VSIPDKQIAQLKFMVDFSEEPVEFSIEDLQPGEIITISRGPLQGLIGELCEVKGKHQVAIRIQKFGCALTTVSLSCIKRENPSM
jgi:transcription antitermination factor NusG